VCILGKRATIKDIAKLAGVSLGSVHCALTGKEGVGKKTRQRILAIAKKINYRPNSSAAALKRKQLQIVAAFPGTNDDNRFYYTGIWQGVRDYFNTVSDLNINCIEIPYKNYINDSTDELSNLPDDAEIHGLVTVGYLDQRGEFSIQRFIERNIPVALVVNDAPNLDRLCCVQPEYRITGCMLAEFITRQIPPTSSILLWAGDPRVPSHYMIVEGFLSFMMERNLPNPVHKVYSFGTHEADRKSLSEAFLQKKPGACYCVNARDSVLMGAAVREAEMSGKIIAIGSDLFRENFRFLKDGIFTNLVHKNPYLQAYLAGKYLTDYIVKGIRPPAELIYVGSELVFQSNVSMFKNGFSQLLL
jgi:LacI family transcriptional regulator